MKQLRAGPCLSLTLCLAVFAVASAAAATVADSDRAIHIVSFVEPPLARYEGEVAGLPATSLEVTGERRLDAGSAHCQSYLAHLANTQERHLHHIARAIGRTPEVVLRYRAAAKSASLLPLLPFPLRSSTAADQN